MWVGLAKHTTKKVDWVGVLVKIDYCKFWNKSQTYMKANQLNILAFNCVVVSDIRLKNKITLGYLLY